MLKVVFVLNDLSELVVDAEKGQSILQIAENHHINLKGACGGNCSCSTCHVILEQKWFDKTQEVCPITDKEDDALEFAADLSTTSRLACQLKMSEQLDGIRVIIPEIDTIF